MKLKTLFLCLGLLPAAASWSLAAQENPGAGTVQALRAGWQNPARTYKPHTRWWWPGNALTKADITWQLEQMAAQGMGGVEIASMWKMYEKGNAEYLSPEHLELLKHAVAEAKRLNLEVAISFCPGWGFGGSWVPPADQNKKLSVGTRELPGGSIFSGPLPAAEPNVFKSPYPPGPGSIVAVVTARVTAGNRLDPASLTVLTDKVAPGSDRLEWQAPPGQWRLMVFWLTLTGQQSSAQSFDPPPMEIDLLSKGAVQRYCDHLGGVLESAVGSEFGRTVDSLFSDSSETVGGRNSTLWSTDTLAQFRQQMGYDLTPYLPALWFDIGPLTPRVRYDVGLFLNNLGLDTFYQTFTAWSKAHGVQARIQPHYRFTNELEQGAGASTRPETEVTTARFEPMADPRMAEASGARFYGRSILSAEAYTFLHTDRYRTTLEELKIATDAFLRDGVTQFYNHAFFGSPERQVAPSRDMPWANRIDPWSPWWKYYHDLAAYVARSCFLLRQGRLVADVAVYSPQATAWSERAIWGIDRRIMHYGNLAKTLVANGYNFDIVNDDLLQHHATFQGGKIHVNGYGRRILILPQTTVIPIETMRAIAVFARSGGTVVALGRLPAAAAGLTDYPAHDRELQGIVRQVFGTATEAGQGGVYLPGYEIDDRDFSPMEQPYRPTPPLDPAQRQLLAALERVAPPDFALAGGQQSDGLTFLHQQLKGADVYFVCNLEPKRIATAVTFGVGDRQVQRWNAMTGEISAVRNVRTAGGRTTIDMEFEPWESEFFVFTSGTALASPAPSVAQGLPEAPVEVPGPWQMKLEGYGFDPFAAVVPALASWTDAPRTRHFSGTGRYDTDFPLPAERLAKGARLILDLGRVGTVAEVELNGQPAGVAWMEPYRLDITRLAQAGNNHLTVFVTDTLINYVTGLKTPPEVPLGLQPRLGRANPAIYAQSKVARQDMSETDLPPSGLIGPVRIVSPSFPPAATNP